MIGFGRKAPIRMEIDEWEFGKQLKKVHRKMTLYSNDILPSHLLQAVRATASSVFSDAKSMAPVDTGLMRDVLKVVPIQRRKRKGQIRIGYKVVLSAEDMGLNARTFYPQWQELGAPKRPLPAVRFLRRAAIKNRKLLPAMAAAQVNRSLRAISRRRDT